MMKKIMFMALAGFLVFACNDEAKDATFGSKEVKMESMEDSISYLLGYKQGEYLRRQELDETVNFEVYNMAMAQSMEQEASKIDRDAEMKLSARFYAAKREQMMAVQKAKMMEDMKTNFATELEAAETFLAEKEKEDGVMKTESGLLYKVISEGDGATPRAEDRVSVHYHGTLPDGTVFDSSVERGEPSKFGLTQVIAGWTEGLQLMKEGAKYEFYIHPALGYGTQDKGTIKPASALVFEVELLEIL